VVGTDDDAAGVDSGGPRLLAERGADELDHPGGTLGAHLRRVADRLARHGADETTRLAGLWHAAYGTDGFPVALFGLDERDLVAGAVGQAAEAEVYLYASCDRAATYPGLGAPIVTFVDRFSGAAAGLPRERLATFAAITVANELDIVDHLALDGAGRARLHGILAPMADLVTPAARADLERTLAVTAGLDDEAPGL
jgi:hypothetical protein